MFDVATVSTHACDAGHFDWAPRPDEEVFAETPVPVTSAAAAEESDEEDDGVPGAAEDVPSPLQGADPENTEVLVSDVVSCHSLHRLRWEISWMTFK